MRSIAVIKELGGLTIDTTYSVVKFTNCMDDPLSLLNTQAWNNYP